MYSSNNAALGIQFNYKKLFEQPGQDIRVLHRLVHLDLKGCPIKTDFLAKLFPVFNKWGVTGILIEWEDTFPYDEELTSIGSLNPSKSSYSPFEVEEIIKMATVNNLEIIPLVQTIGHLEFVLKHSQWQHLREVEKYSSCLCPMHPSSITLVTTMINQIVKQHPNIKFLHIGADEVWHMGVCSRCLNQEKSRLFLNHIISVLKYIRQHFPQIQSIMWDDMLRSIDNTIIQEFDIGQYVEPMIWNYQSAEAFNLTRDLFSKHSCVFRTIWIASAFKGATGSCQILPVVGQHISNHKKWLEVFAEIRNDFNNIRGIVLTGWSRYDHFAAPCELLPTAMSSLALCLTIWLHCKYDNSMIEHISSILGYSKESPLVLYPNIRKYPVKEKLKFPGYQICNTIEWFVNIRSRYNCIAYSDQAVTWLNRWQVKHNYTSLMHVEQIHHRFQQLYNELLDMEHQLKNCLPEMLYPDTIDEYLGTYFYPLKDNLHSLIKDAENQLNTTPVTTT